MAAACTGFIEPLNLECIVINIFAGSLDLFLFISFMVVAMMAGRFKMRNGPATLIFALFAIIFSTYMPGIYVVVILLGGLIIFAGLRTPFTRE